MHSSQSRIEFPDLKLMIIDTPHDFKTKFFLNVQKMRESEEGGTFFP